MNETDRTPTLAAKASTGKDKFWFNTIVCDGKNYFLQSHAWTASATQVDAVRLSVPRLVSVKNVGQANESAPLEQAEAEMMSGWRKKLDAGYHPLNAEESTEQAAGGFPFLPMLAHPFKDRAHRIQLSEGVYVQPKYNGQRALFNPQHGFWSRQGKLINPEATAHLRFEYDGLIPETLSFDGELILPAKFGGFQETMRAVKKYRPESTPELCYRVYDVFDTARPKMGFRDRLAQLHRIFGLVELPSKIRLSQSRMVSSEAELLDAHVQFTADGYEGTIIRLPHGVYTPGQRGDNLLKMKDFLDAEFEVVGFTDGLGRDAGAIVFECRNAAGLKFSVRPEGTIESRREMFAHGSSYVGQQLTVRYQALSNDGLPIFPVGAGFGLDRQAA